MNYKVLFVASMGLLSLSLRSTAQRMDYSYSSGYIDLAAGIGNQPIISLSYQYIWHSDVAVKSRKKPIIMEVGIGAKFSSFFGSNTYFVSVPGLDSLNERTPLGIPKQDTDPKHMDSVLVSSAQINSLNFKINFGFCLKDRFHIGFNADIIGFSFGGSRKGTYINGSHSQPVTVTPAAFNFFGGWNESGTVSTEFYLACKVSSKCLLKIGYQIYVLEYLTDTEVQQYPKSNDRFRYTLPQATAGIIYKINSKAHR